MISRTAHRLPLFAAALSAAALAGPSASAKVPLTLTQEGRLFESNDVPVSGTRNITFAFYGVETGGNAIWNDTLAVKVDNGYFSVQLGDGTPIVPETLFDGANRYLGITIAGDEEMTPRQKVSSVPYALVARDVTGDIHPSSVTVNGVEVIDANGAWVGPALPAGPQGPMGPIGPTGATGPQGATGPAGPSVYTNPNNLKQYSLNAVYCGVSSTSYTGDLMAAVPGAPNGYAAAKQICEGVVGCGQAAHMCTAEEVIRTLAVDGQFLPPGTPQAWYGSGVLSVSSSFVFDDCVGWTSATSSHQGSDWAGGPQAVPCTDIRPVMCCL